MRPSLRGKVLGTIVMVYALAFAAYAVIVAKVLIADGRVAERSRLAVVAQYLRSDLERLLTLGIPLGNIIGFEANCERVATILTDIDYVTVTDDRGKVSACAPSQSLPPWLPGSSSGEAVSREAALDGTGYLEVAVPVSDLSGRVAGYVRIGMETAKADRNVIAAVVRASAGAVAVLLVGLAATIYLMGRFLGGPLANLVDGIRRIGTAPDDPGRRLRIGTGDEIEEIANAFNDTIERLHRVSVARTTLRESEERVRLLLESTGDGIFALDRAGYCVLANPACARMLGHAGPEALLGRPVHEFLGGAGSQFRLVCALPIHSQTHGTDEVCKKNDGAAFPVEYHAYPIRRGGAIVGTVVSFYDITERKEAERAVLREKRRAESYLELAGTIFVATDRDGRVLRVNRRGTEVLGWTEKELLGRPWIEAIFPEERRAEAVRLFEQALSEAPADLHSYEMPARVRDGSLRQVAWTTRAMTDENGVAVGALSSGEDVTARREIEHLLQQAQRMEALGCLAGGIAHDFNNMLVPITNLTELTLQRLPADSADRRRLEMVIEAAQRAKQLVQKILAFSRSEEPVWTELDLCSTVRNAMSLAGATMPATIRLVDDLDPRTGNVSGDPAQLETVLLNLISNASDAIGSDHGTITVTLRAVDVNDDLAAKVQNLRPGAFALLTVADTGAGMSAETKARALDPFFTTKDVGRGTGLGLSSVYGIVSKHGGALHIASVVGAGTTIKVYLRLRPAVSDMTSAGVRTDPVS